MASTKLLNAVLSEKEPGNAIPIQVTVDSVGSSTCGPSHVSVVRGDGVIVVFTTKLNLRNVEVVNNEVVVTEGSPGEEFILVFLNQNDAEDWTILIRTDRQAPGSGETFTAGNGIGVKS